MCHISLGTSSSSLPDDGRPQGSAGVPSSLPISEQSRNHISRGRSTGVALAFQAGAHSEPAMTRVSQGHRSSGRYHTSPNEYCSNDIGSSESIGEARCDLRHFFCPSSRLLVTGSEPCFGSSVIATALPSLAITSGSPVEINRSPMAG